MRPGWERQYEECPPIFPTVCIGRIMTHTRLEDGRFNLLLQGVQRGRIVREIPTDRMYRMAEIGLPVETPAPGDAALRAACESLRARFLELSRREGVLDDEAMQCLAAEHLSPGTLADLIAFSMEISPIIKQQVLDTFDPSARIELVSRQLQPNPQARAGDRPRAGFPPCFSPN
jgi:Lon protease-like protein